MPAAVSAALLLGVATASADSGVLSPHWTTSTTTSLSTAATPSVTIPDSSSVALGTSVQDLATIQFNFSPPPTGNVTYSFFDNATCSGTVATTDSVAVKTDGSVPVSNATGPLAAGSYSFQAAYPGDSQYPGSTSSCEPFSVNTGTTYPTTSLTNAFGGTPIPDGATVALGTSVIDTGTLGPSSTAVPPGGWAYYSFFGNGDCTSPPISSEHVEINSDGSVPNSSPTGALSAGSYSFDLWFQADNNYPDSTSPCEPFTVSTKGGATTATALTYASNGSPIALNSALPLGTSVEDTSTVSGDTSTTKPTGGVTYNFFDNSACTGAPATTDPVTIGSSGVPNSTPTGSLGPGSYSFDAVYSGDGTFTGSTSTCEPFTLSAGTVTVTTALANASGGSITSGSTVPTGTSVLDTATVKGSSTAFTPSGGVTYNFFDNSACTGSPATTDPVTIGSSGVPNSTPTGTLAAGSYAFDASYAGDTNFGGGTSGCEPFTVGQTLPMPTVSTTVYDGATNAPWTGTEVAGASAYDTSTVSGLVGGPLPTGTVTYNFFYTSDCTATPYSTSTVTIGSNGKVPNSETVGPLGEGSYAFDAVYSGDSNYATTTSPCEPFTVGLQPLSKVALYVKPAVDGGTDTGNTCTFPAQPCATIAHALIEEASLSNGAFGSVINLANGFYNDPTDTMFASLQVGNDNVTIKGTGKNSVVLPQTCSALGEATVGPDTGSFAMAVFENQTSAVNGGDALEGITIEDMTLIGGNISSCANYKAGILMTNGGDGDAVVDLTLESGAPYGILMDDNANSSIISDNLSSTLCTGTVTGPNKGLNQGWTSPANLKVTKIPKCAQFVESKSRGFTAISINGIAYCATGSGSKKVLAITGVPTSGSCANPTPIKDSGGAAIAKGAQVIYNTSAPAFTQYGIACNGLDQASWDTDCAISDTTVSGLGIGLSNTPIGILVTGTATATLSANTVSNITDAKKDGIGIGLLPNQTAGQTAGSSTVGLDTATNTGSGNTLSADDNSVVAAACPTVSSGCIATPASAASWEISANTVGANAAGITVRGVQTGTDLGRLNLSSNKVTNVTSGVGMWLAADSQAGGSGPTCTTTSTFCVGGVTSSLGNTTTGNEIGLDLNDGTTGLTLQDNTVDNNVMFGVVVAGENTFPELGSLGGTTPSSGNVFSSDTWTGNGVPAAKVVNGGANIIDFTGFCGQSGPPCNNPSAGGSAPTLGTASLDCLFLNAPISAGFGATAGTISLVNKCSVSPATVAPGTLIIVSTYLNNQGNQVSLFVTQLATIGSTPTAVTVAPIIPALGLAASTVVSGTTVGVTANDQPGFATNPISSNTYASNNSCVPTEPNTSTTLTLGTGGGAPNTTAGAETGYDAC